MKKNIVFILLFASFVFNQNLFKLSQRDFLENPNGKQFTRGNYLIILGDESLNSSLDNAGGNFLEFKASQGYDVEVVNYPDIATNQNELRDYISNYYSSYPLLEYILLVGDVTGAYAIPTHVIDSYNDADYPLDQTDYPYTFFSDEDMYNPHFFIGRWSIQDQSELLSIISRTIGYTRLIHPVTGSNLNTEYLDNALIVAGNYSDTPGVAWPVTPVWTSQWLKDRLVDFNYSNIDEFYFTASNPNEDQTSEITSSWSDGVGIINYRGWGDASGWKKPIFKKEHIEDLSNGWELPVVFSFVCNTGDFGNENNETCFGEKMIKTGTFINPKGAVAMVGPSDLDTDTKFNNVICADVWDHLLEERISELAPALHAGKQAVLKEFGYDFEATGAAGTANIAEFYHHVYGVLGDPSLSVWIGQPSNMVLDIEENHSLMNSFVEVVVSNEQGDLLEDVVGALIYDNQLVGKGLSNSSGELSIDFDSSISQGSELIMYLNKDQFFQEKITLIYSSDNGALFVEPSYSYEQEVVDYTQYKVYNNYDDDEKAPEYDWVEINQLGTNLELTDDSHASISLPFDFQYYGEVFDSLTISSNGWISFIPTDINYFWNFSIPFPIGPSGMIAPFMDDLDDDDSDDPDPLDIYYYYDSENNRFIVEWDEIHNGEDNQECAIEGYECITETFQVILYDPTYYITDTGDGEIKFQYKEIHDIDNGNYDGKWGNYSTIGIESPDQNYGVQYQFRNELEDFYGNQVGTLKVENEMAILFTTGDDNQLSIGLDDKIIPNRIALYTNHPNPFNPITTIKFSINTHSKVDLLITDISGREVSRLVSNKLFYPGVYQYEFDANSLSTGIYFYTLKSDSDIITNKMLYLK